MADLGNGTDGSSIKPVSSLRSHFENMASSKLAPETPSVNSVLKPPIPSPRRQQESHTLERTSIDVSRSTSPFSVSKDRTILSQQQSARVSREPGTNPQRTGSSPRRRPTSMISLSSPHSHPLILVDSPQSPPNPFLLPAQQPSSHPSSGGSSRLIDSRSHSPQGFHTPPGQLHDGHLPSSSESYSSIKDRNAWQDSAKEKNRGATSREDLSRRIIHAPNKPNEKPKVPAKPIAAKSYNLSSGSSNFGSSKNLLSTSAPQNYDESPELGSKTSLVCDESNYRPSIAPEDTRKSYMQAPVYALIQNEHASRGKHLNKDVLTIDAIWKSDSPPCIRANNLEGNRPGLPPRREIDTRLQQHPVSMSAPKLNRAWTEQGENQKSVRLGVQKIPPANLSRLSPNSNTTSPDFLPPPRRAQSSVSSDTLRNKTQISSQTKSSLRVSGATELKGNLYSLQLDIDVKQISEYPDTSSVNRRPPYLAHRVQKIETRYDTKIFDISSRYICTTGYLTKAWDLMSGGLVMNIGHGEKEIRATAMAFKSGLVSEEEGKYVWLGTNHGDLHEVDISTQTTMHTKPAAHNRREIVKIFRCQDSMWTLDDDGKLYVWPPDNTGSPNLQSIPYSRKVPKGHSYSLIIDDNLWLATGKDIRVFRPNAKEDERFSVTEQPLSQPGVGEITSAAVIPCEPQMVYFGHADGKVTTYSTVSFTCLGVYNVSAYKINTLAGAGSYLWAGYSTGVISVYDTRIRPWSTKKEWQAHDHPVINLLARADSIEKSGLLRVASIGTDNAVRMWDGLLEDDWLELDMQEHDINYCSFREIKAKVLTWNAGASTPTSLQYDERNKNFFREFLQTDNPPELLVFGFQELVDLEDKKLTAKSLFKGNKKKDPSEQEHMSRQYRAWRDYLVRCIEDAMPSDEPYHLLHTASMVGLFSCVFVKSSESGCIKNVSTAEIKRGMGGLHGNKGALVLRFVLDDSSLCFINCHLAAGQTQTVHRNSDAAAILESSVLNPERDMFTRCDTYTGGGDGSMILDHEICILNGDLNYRIDTMGRDTVIKSIHSENYTRLLERDQLLVSRRRNPGFRLRAFDESPIRFAPTYKYDPNSNKYDTSEKHRAPAWCDRILYRGSGKIKQIGYQRHELQISDHRPVSGSFVIRIKKVLPNKRDMVWKSCKTRFENYKHEMLNEK